MTRSTPRGLTAAVLSFAALLAAGPVAAGLVQSAAASPGAARSSADCAALPAVDRSACNHCIKRVKKHAYDNTLKPGRRCLADEAEAGSVTHR